MISSFSFSASPRLCVRPAVVGDSSDMGVGRSFRRDGKWTRLTGSAPAVIFPTLPTLDFRMDSSPDQQSEDEAEKLSALRDALDVGLAELERGEGIPGPLAVEQAKAEFHRIIAREQEALRRAI